MMTNIFQYNVNHRIVSLRFELDDCRQYRNFHRAAEIRLEIAKLQELLRNAKKNVETT